MFYALVLIPAFTTAAAFLLYKQVGKREFLKLDAVQFIYAFVLSPLSFIWLKSFLLFFAKNEVNPNLSQTEIFAIDTAFSVGFLFFYAFVVIHSLTKSFEMKRHRDPLYDILADSESFHLWISHSFLYSLLLLLVTLLGLTNVFIPLDLTLTKPIFYGVLALGSLGGFLAFAAVYLSNFTEYKFMKLMKLIFAALFSLHVLAYFFFDPKFGASFVVYWASFSIFGSLVFASFILEKSQRSRRFIDRFHHKHSQGWTAGNFLTMLEGRK
jgi:hypothetical protein